MIVHDLGEGENLHIHWNLRDRVSGNFPLWNQIYFFIWKWPKSFHPLRGVPLWVRGQSRIELIWLSLYPSNIIKDKQIWRVAWNDRYRCSTDCHCNWLGLGLWIILYKILSHLFFRRPQLLSSTNVGQVIGGWTTQNIEVVAIFGGYTSGVYNQRVAIQWWKTLSIARNTRCGIKWFYWTVCLIWTRPTSLTSYPAEI